MLHVAWARHIGVSSPLTAARAWLRGGRTTQGTLMDQLAGLVDVLTIVALVSGLLFAAFEWRGSRRESRRQSQIRLLRSFESLEFLKAMQRLLFLPPMASRRRRSRMPWARTAATCSGTGWARWSRSASSSSTARSTSAWWTSPSAAPCSSSGASCLTTSRPSAPRSVATPCMSGTNGWWSASRPLCEEGRTPAHLLHADWRP